MNPLKVRWEKEPITMVVCILVSIAATTLTIGGLVTYGSKSSNGASLACLVFGFLLVLLALVLWNTDYIPSEDDSYVSDEETSPTAVLAETPADQP